MSYNEKWVEISCGGAFVFQCLNANYFNFGTIMKKEVIEYCLKDITMAIYDRTDIEEFDISENFCYSGSDLETYMDYFVLHGGSCEVLNFPAHSSKISCC